MLDFTSPKRVRWLIFIRICLLIKRQNISKPVVKILTAIQLWSTIKDVGFWLRDSEKRLKSLSKDTWMNIMMRLDKCDFCFPINRHQTRKRKAQYICFYLQFIYYYFFVSMSIYGIYNYKYCSRWEKHTTKGQNKRNIIAI